MNLNGSAGSQPSKPGTAGFHPSKPGTAGFQPAIIMIVALLAPQQTTAQESPQETGRQVTASLKTGLEYDDNVRRESVSTDDGFLTRYFGTLGLVSSPFQRSVIAFDANHGGKFFLTDDQADSDTLITQIATSFQHRPLKTFAYDAQLDMKDRTERAPVRDYNRGGGGGGASFFFGPFDFRVGGAWRYFAFKPNAGASSSSVEGSFRASYRPWEPLRLTASYNVAPRFFQTDRTDEVDGNIVFVDGEVREDLFHVASLRANFRTGPIVLEGDYTFSSNSSNSFGQDLTRNAGSVSFTGALPWDLFVSGKIDLQRTTYGDPVQIDATFLVDEDNRNAIIASLVKAIDRFEIELKYSLYLQEFGVGSDYRRQTFLFAVGYAYD